MRAEDVALSSCDSSNVGNAALQSRSWDATNAKERAALESRAPGEGYVKALKVMMVKVSFTSGSVWSWLVT